MFQTFKLLSLDCLIAELFKCILFIGQQTIQCKKKVYFFLLLFSDLLADHLHLGHQPGVHVALHDHEVARDLLRDVDCDPANLEAYHQGFVDLSGNALQWKTDLDVSF